MLLYTDTVVSEEPSVSVFIIDAVGPYPRTNPQLPEDEKLVVAHCVKLAALPKIISISLSFVFH